MVDAIFRYILVARVEDALRCGWMALPGLSGCHHGEYAVLCEWLCQCRPANVRGRP